MKTIAISVDDETLGALDRLAGQVTSGKSRSAVVRIAVQRLAEQEQQRESEAREHEILRRHATRLQRQARALVAEQAKP